MDLGIPPYLISATVVGVIAQRLLRKVCPHCAESRQLTVEEQEYLQISGAGQMVMEGAGCKECRGTGYKGRTGIFEVLEINERVKPLVAEPVDLADLVRIASKDGYTNLRQVATRKMLEGITTYDEVVSITG
jgi:general secretion pathway protein E